MKKILVLSSALLLSAACFAWIGEDETNTVDTLKRQGYSESTLRIVDMVNYENKGKYGDYEKYYTKPKSKSKLGRGYSKVKFYVDPSQDDYTFGERQINFTNNWMGDETTYSPKESQQKEEVENL